MKKKNLEKAVVLGLLLSMSVYGSVYAADTIVEGVRIEGITHNKSSELNILFGDNADGDVVYDLSGSFLTNNKDGTVNIKGNSLKVNATGNENLIYSSSDSGPINNIIMKGDITVDSYGKIGIAESSKLNMESTDGNIDLNLKNYTGISNSQNSETNIIADNGNISINVDATSLTNSNQFLYGIFNDTSYFSSTEQDKALFNLKGNDITVSTKGDSVRELFGIYNHITTENSDAITNLNADNEILIQAQAKEVSTGLVGVLTENTTGNINKEAATNINVTGDNGKITISAIVDKSNGSHSSHKGVNALYNEKGTNNIVIEGNNGSVNIWAEAKESPRGVNSVFNTDGKTNIDVNGSNGSVNIVAKADTKTSNVNGIFNKISSVRQESETTINITGDVNISAIANSAGVEGTIGGNAIEGGTAAIFNETRSGLQNEGAANKVEITADDGNVNLISKNNSNGESVANGYAFGIKNKIFQAGTNSKHETNIKAGKDLNIIVDGVSAYGIFNSNGEGQRNVKICNNLQGENVDVSVFGSNSATGIYTEKVGSETKITGTDKIDINAIVKEGLPANGEDIDIVTGEPMYFPVINSATGIDIRGQGTIIDLSGKEININAINGGEHNSETKVSSMSYGIADTLAVTAKKAYVNMQSSGDTNISAVSENGDAYGIETTKTDINITSDGKVNINGIAENSIGYGITAGNKNSNDLTKVEIDSKLGNTIYGTTNALNVSGAGLDIDISTKANNRLQSEKGYVVNAKEGVNVDINADVDNYVLGNSTAIYSNGEGTNVALDAGKDNIVKGKIGIFANDSVTITVKAIKNNVIEATDETAVDGWGEVTKVYLTAENNIISGATTGVRAFNNAEVSLTGTENNIVKANIVAVQSQSNEAKVSLTAGNNILEGAYGVYALSNAKADINASMNNIINAGSFAVHATDDASVNLTAVNGINKVISKATGENQNAVYANSSDVDMLAKTNIIQAGNVAEENETGITGYFGNKTVIYASGGSTVDIEAKSNNALAENLISGTVRVEDKDSVANIKSTGNNYIYSSAHGPGYDGTANLSAVFARNQGVLNIDGDKNFIATHCENHAGETAKAAEADPASESERVVWAQGQGIINIKGQTQIIASRAEENYCGKNHDHTEDEKEAYQGNHMGIAVTAGSEQLVYKDGAWYSPDDLNGDPVDFGNERSTVNIEYNGAHQMLIDEDGNLNGLDDGRVNYIAGDVVAGVNGLINIAAKVDAAAKNNAKSNMYIKGNLLAGNGGEINVDLGDNGILYGRVDDYGEANLGEHVSFYNPVFSNNIDTSGAVNLTMGNNSKWTLDGQSWITDLKIGEGSVIDMSYQKDDKTYNQQAHALTIRNIEVYNSSDLAVANERDKSVKFIMDLDLKNPTDTDMVYIQDGSGDFKVEINNFEGDYETLTQNNTLRFATVGNAAEGVNFSEVKLSGEGINDIIFKVGNTANGDKEGSNAGNDEYNGGDDLSASKPGDNNVNNENSHNFFLSGIEGATANDNAEVIVDMSQANYSNAVYMDRLNKRMGEMRYINNEEDEGLWVRMRHARVGKDNAFKYNSNMYEIGYDEKQECDNGMRRVGVAIDYMHGDTTYSNVGGKGEVSRRGVWLYDTWLGDKGHYADYVLKWGHLANDYEIHNKKATNKINGEYSNNVFSISAEYGRKKDIGNDWYIEPQAQLQYARVTAADYVTTQGTEVSVSSIDSLIARAGFRLGKDLSERSSIYFKGDVLHEFCGNQNIYAKDKTGVMDRTYENKGTWYDLGVGFATELNKDTYFYADYERTFGNDNDKTYQVNVGLNWSF